MADDHSPIENTQLEKKNFILSGSLLSIVAIFLALIALIFALRSVQQNHNWTEQSASLLNIMKDNDAAQSRSIKNLQMSLENNNSQQEAFNEKVSTLHQDLESIKQQRHYGQEEWLLLKARYYLELAEIQSHWGDNLSLNIALLEQADKLLSTTSNAKLFAIRQAIAKEIAPLKALPKVDLVGLLSRLDAQQKAVEHLTMATTLTMPQNSILPEKKSNSSWRSHWQASINNLEKMVIIRHHDDDIKPLYSTLEIGFRRDMIHHNLQEASWALLRQNTAVYQHALAEAVSNIQKYFDVQDKNTQSLLQELQALKKMPLSANPSLNLQIPIQSLNQLINTKASDASL